MLHPSSSSSWASSWHAISFKIDHSNFVVLEILWPYLFATLCFLSCTKHDGSFLKYPDVESKVHKPMKLGSHPVHIVAVMPTVCNFGYLGSLQRGTQFSPGPLGYFHTEFQLVSCYKWLVALGFPQKLVRFVWDECLLDHRVLSSSHYTPPATSEKTVHWKRMILSETIIFWFLLGGSSQLVGG